jgi:hypothetical protein
VTGPGGNRKRPGNEEPEPTLEDDLPSDGRDEKGEAMIRDLPESAGSPQAPKPPSATADKIKKGR